MFAPCEICGDKIPTRNFNRMNRGVCLFCIEDSEKKTNTPIPVCEICGNVMPSKKFKRNGKDCCISCIDIYKEV